MRRAVLDNSKDANVVIKAAAPLDFRPKVVAAQKIKKKTADLTIELEPTTDILKELGSRKNGAILVGFAAETENHVANAVEKLRAKNLDLIVVNPASGPDSAFDSDMNHATIIDASGHTEEIPLVSKSIMADRILDRVVQLLK
jgi:phosphopantothenoylcysteine decarboxylase/phosphopantothenate--cysteine ligase